MSIYSYHLTGQNSDFAKIMAKITHYQPHSDDDIMMMSEMSHGNKKSIIGLMNCNITPLLMSEVPTEELEISVRFLNEI